MSMLCRLAPYSQSSAFWDVVGQKGVRAICRNYIWARLFLAQIDFLSLTVYWSRRASWRISGPTSSESINWFSFCWKLSITWFLFSKSFLNEALAAFFAASNIALDCACCLAFLLARWSCSSLSWTSRVRKEHAAYQHLKTAKGLYTNKDFDNGHMAIKKA